MRDDAPPLPWAESRWERCAVAPAVDDAFVREALRPWPRLASLPWTVLGGGLRSLNLRIGDHLVARIGAEGPAQVRKEAALLRHLAGRVRVPAVEGIEGDVLLLEFVPHVDLPGTGEAGRQAGLALAALQGMRFPAAGFLAADGEGTLTVIDPAPSSRALLASWLEESLAGPAAGRLAAGHLSADAVRRLLDAEGSRLDEAAGETVLVHSDFKPANVKWLPTEGRVLVLDWEFAWAGPPLFDAGMLFRWGTPDPFREGFEEGCAAGGRPLPSHWFRTAALLDLHNLVALLARPAVGPTMEADLLRRVAETPGIAR